MADYPTLPYLGQQFAEPSALEDTLEKLRRTRALEQRGYTPVPYSEREDFAGQTSEAYRQDNPDDFIRRLIVETNHNVRPKDVPLMEEDRLLGIRPKLPNRMLMDRRREYFLDKMLNTYGRPTVESDPELPDRYGPMPSGWEKLPPDVAEAMYAYATEDPTNIRGNYENTGFLGPGAPLATMARWSQSLPAAVGGLAELGANAVGGRAKSSEKIVEDMTRAAGTLYGADSDSAWADMARVRKEQDGDMALDRDRLWYQSLIPDDSQAQMQEQLAGRIEGSDDMLARYKAEDLIGRLGRQSLGAVMDATLSPLFGGREIQQAARAGKPVSAWLNFAAEYGPDAALTGYAASQER